MILVENRSLFGEGISYEWYSEKERLHLGLSGVRFASVEEAKDKALACGYVLEEVLVLKVATLGAIPFWKLCDANGKEKQEGLFTSKKSGFDAASKLLAKA